MSCEVVVLFLPPDLFVSCFGYISTTYCVHQIRHWWWWPF